jgi:hypothetical protein
MWSYLWHIKLYQWNISYLIFIWLCCYKICIEFLTWVRMNRKSLKHRCKNRMEQVHLQTCEATSLLQYEIAEGDTHSLALPQHRWTHSYQEWLPRRLTHLPHLPSYCGVGNPRIACNSSRSWRTLGDHLTLHSSDILGQPHPRAKDLRPPAHRSTLSHLLPVLLTLLTGCHS